MSERRTRRAVTKKHKSALDADFKQGGSGRSKQPINLCHLLKAPPCQQTLEHTDDDVILNIHSPVEARGSLMERVNCMKQDESTISKKREFTCYDAEKEMYDDRFWSFFMQIGIALYTKAKRSQLSICSGLIGPSLRRRRTLVPPSLKLLLLVNIMRSKMSCN
jgi:hypothetical protein